MRVAHGALSLYCHRGHSPGVVWLTRAAHREERDISNSAVASLRDSLCALQIPVGEHVAKVTQVDKLEGAVRLLFVRGRPRLGFEFDQPKLRWAVLPSAGGEELGKGTITFEEIADDCGGEYEFEVKCSGSSPGEPAQQARSALRQASEPIAACINAWRDRTLTAAVGGGASA